MDIIVCVKRVPDTNEADIQISGDSKSINTKGLVFDLNDWDKYAVEEAVRLREKHGGAVTVITMGDAESDDVLRRSYATGADNAIRLTDDSYAGSDATAVASILAGAIKGLNYDLILFGAQASDDGYGSTGQTVASMLGIPCTSLAVELEITDGKARVQRELEAGMHEIVEVPLPSVVTIQTGINEPRYVSIMGIRKASSKEIRTPGKDELGINDAEIGLSGSRTKIDKLYMPPVLKETEFLSGSNEEISSKLAHILKDKGGTI